MMVMERVAKIEKNVAPFTQAIEYLQKMINQEAVNHWSGPADYLSAAVNTGSSAAADAARVAVRIVCSGNRSCPSRWPSPCTARS
jgi:hypothetical protein